MNASVKNVDNNYMLMARGSRGESAFRTLSILMGSWPLN